MLSFVLRNPTRKASQFSKQYLNPYITVILTFLATVSKHAETLSVLERSVPWEDLAQFFTTIPKMSWLPRAFLSQESQIWHLDLDVENS